MTASATATRRAASGPRFWLYTGVIVLAAVAASVLLGQGPSTTAALDPDNPGPGGAQALARVLAENGVRVDVVRSAGELDRSTVDEATTVLVTSTDLLGASTAERLVTAAAAGHLVVVEPGPGTARALGLTPGTAVALDGPVAADCTDARLTGLEIDLTGGTEYPTAQGCFPGDHGFLVGTQTEGVTVLGAAEMLSNAQITDADNAAAALRLLGERDRLVWYVPDLADLTAGDGVSLTTLLPAWVRPGMWLLGFAGLGLLLWRGRRLGPLVTEPLPVVVKAIETTRSRGRLYRKVNDRTHAAGVLRAAARRRLADRLHLPPAAADDADALAGQVAVHVGHPFPEVLQLISPAAPPPATDHDLIALASRLAELDREVRRT